MLSVLGYVTLFIGTLYYNMYLKEKETRTLLRYACWIGLFGGLTSLIFVLRWNEPYLGIGDTTFIICTDFVVGTLGLAYTQLPIMILFSKITPPNIEATCFAFLTGTFNFSNFVVAPLIGSTINDLFVGVTADDLSRFHILQLIAVVGAAFPFLFL